MGYLTHAEKEQQLWNEKARYDAGLMPFNRSGPRSLVDEDALQYRRRVLPMLQAYAPNFQDVKVDDARGTAFDLLERQIFEEAAREARQPTQIAEKRRAAGRIRLRRGRL
jgi:hypothetical protein